MGGSAGHMELLFRFLYWAGITARALGIGCLLLGPLLVLYGLRAWQFYYREWQFVLDSNAGNGEVIVGIVVTVGGFVVLLASGRKRVTHRNLKSIREWENRKLLNPDLAYKYRDIVMADSLGHIPLLPNVIEVIIANMRNTPETLSIRVGDAVRWMNQETSDVAHTVTCDHPADPSAGSWDSVTLDPGQSFTYTFRQSGEFRYGCTLHNSPSAGCRGIIRVAE